MEGFWGMLFSVVMWPFFYWLPGIQRTDNPKHIDLYVMYCGANAGIDNGSMEDVLEAFSIVAATPALFQLAYVSRTRHTSIESAITASLHTSTRRTLFFVSVALYNVFAVYITHLLNSVRHHMYYQCTA